MYPDRPYGLNPAGPLRRAGIVLAAVLSVDARRVLPGHLLRRSQVLSSLPIGLSRFQQRVAVTGATRCCVPRTR